mgnify:CR=1 FL=1
MKNFFLTFILFTCFIFSPSLFAISETTEFETTCAKTNDLTGKSIACFNETDPLQSVGLFFGCSQMLQYSILTKKDGRIKKAPRRLVFDIENIYFRPKFTEEKNYIKRKTLELKSASNKNIGQCKIIESPAKITEELKLILDVNTSRNIL